MEIDSHKKLILEAPIGFAHHKILLDESGQPNDFIYLEVNRAFERITGIRAEMLAGRKFSEIHRRVKRMKLNLLDLYGEVALNGSCRTFDYFSESLQQWSKAVVFSNEKYFFTIFFVDITNEKKQLIELAKNLDSISEYNEKLQQLNEEIAFMREILDNVMTERNNLIEELSIVKEKLDLLNLQKDKVCSIIAHDLRSPFSGLLGISKMLSDNLQSLTQEEIQDFAKALKDSIESTYKLLENLLEWSRLQRGMIPFKPDYFNFGELVAEVAAVQEVKANEKGIAIVNNVPNDLIVYADYNMLNTVLRNLVSNAIKFTPRGGKVEIASKDNGDSIEVSVKDTGIGIPEEMIPQLFKVGAKTSRSGTEGESSSGFGLILCKELIDKHLGKIWVESQVDKGTTFYFTIPQNSGAKETEK